MLLNAKRSVIALIVLAVLVLLIGYGVRAESPADAGSAGDYRMLVHDYAFSPPSVERGDEWDLIELDGLPLAREAGRPELPLRMARLLIPAGYDLVDVQVEAGPEYALAGTYRVAPAAYAVPLSSDGPFPERAYSSQAPFPDAPAGEPSVQTKRGYRTLLVPLYPVRYDPASGQLSYYENLTVWAQLRRSEGQRISGLRAPLPRQRDGESLAVMLDNPNQIDSYLAWEQPTTRGSAPLSPLYEAQYLIITNQALYDVPPPNNLQTLAAYKEGLGITTLITTTEWISATYPIGDSDLQTSIRDFIRDAYNDRNTEYVLLAGDSDTNVPAEIIVPHRGFTATVQTYVDESIPADLYYACLDGTFDYDGDGLYGEPNDGPGGGEVDLQAEVYVGRAPVASDVELRRFVAKTIAYERSEDDYLRDVWMVGELLSSQYSVWGGDLKDDIKEGREGDYLTAGFGNSDYAAFFDTESLYERDGDWTSGDILAAINSPLHLVNHVGHGSKNQVMKLYGYHLSGLRNEHYFFGYSQACDAAWFDVDDSIVEQLVLHEHGAVAFIGNARFGWYMPGSPHVGPSQLFDRFFWDKLLDGGEFAVGRAHQLSKEELALQLGEVQGADRWSYYALNLLGDPQLTIHTTAGGAISYQGHALDDLGGNGDGALDIGERAEITVTLASSYTQTVENVTASLSCDDAYLTVLSDTVGYGDLAGGEVSSGGGTYRVSLADDCPNQRVVACTLWITGTHVAESTQHWQDALPLEIDSQPELGFSPLAFEEELALGEVLTRTLTITNSGPGRLEVDLLANEDWLTVTPSALSIASYLTSSVTMTVDGRLFPASGLYQGEIILESNDADQPTDSVPVNVQTAPLLLYYARDLDDQDGNGDGELDLGESAEMTVTLGNNWTHTIENAVASLACWDSHLTVLSDTVDYGDLAAGQTSGGDRPYRLSLSKDCPNQRDIACTLYITGTHEKETAPWHGKQGLVLEIDSEPELSFSPGSFEEELSLGESLTQTLTISNSGAGNLSVDFLSYQGWLTVTPSEISVPPYAADGVSVTLSTQGFSEPGVREGEILLQSNDAAQPDVSISVTLRTPPLLAYADHTADDAPLGNLSNGNGYLEPGEQVEMWVALRSYHDETTYDVIGTLSTEAPFVSWIRDRAAYGDVQPGQIVTPSQAYSFTLDSDVSGATEITFTLVASATLEDQTRAHWQDSFVVAIERVPWIIPSPQAITATAFTGETLTRTLALANRGSLTTPFTIAVSMPEGGPAAMVEPEAGQIGPNVTRTISVTLMTSLRHFPGYYEGELLIETEDPEHSVWQIPLDIRLRKRYYLALILQPGG